MIIGCCGDCVYGADTSEGDDDLISCRVNPPVVVKSLLELKKTEGEDGTPEVYVPRKRLLAVTIWPMVKINTIGCGRFLFMSKESTQGEGDPFFKESAVTTA